MIPEPADTRGNRCLDPVHLKGPSSQHYVTTGSEPVADTVYRMS